MIWKIKDLYNNFLFFKSNQILIDVFLSPAVNDIPWPTKHFKNETGSTECSKVIWYLISDIPSSFTDRSIERDQRFNQTCIFHVSKERDSLMPRRYNSQTA